MKSFDDLADKDRRFSLRLELSGDQVSTLLQTLGTANELDLQDLVREGLAELTEDSASRPFDSLGGRPAHAG